MFLCAVAPNESTGPTFLTSEPYAALSAPRTHPDENGVLSVHSPLPVTVSGFGVGVEANALTDVPCIPEAMDFGRIPRLQVASIGAICSALRSR